MKWTWKYDPSDSAYKTGCVLYGAGFYWDQSEAKWTGNIVWGNEIQGTPYFSERTQVEEYIEEKLLQYCERSCG